MASQSDYPTYSIHNLFFIELRFRWMLLHISPSSSLQCKFTEFEISWQMGDKLREGTVASHIETLLFQVEKPIYKTPAMSVSTGGMKCNVCGAEKAGLHYSGVVCSCCRVFFLRQTKRAKKAICRRNNNCIILPGALDNCQACRYERCLGANMKPSEVGKQKYTKKEREEAAASFDERKILAVAKRECPSVIVVESVKEEYPALNGESGPSNYGFRGCEANCDYRQDNWSMLPAHDTLPHVVEANTYFPRSVNTNVSAGFMFLNTLGCLQTATEFVNCLLSLQRFIDNPNGLDPVDVYASIDVSLADVLLNSQACSSRAAISFDRWEPEPDAEYNFMHTYCRSITHYADFLTAAPELHSLVEQDKMKLVQYNQMDVCFLAALFEMWQASFTGKALKTRSTRFQLKAEDQMRVDVLISKLKFYHAYFLEILERLTISPGELVVLKFIVLFTPPTGISDHGLCIINNARNKYCQILNNYIAENNPSISLEAHSERVGEMIAMLRMLKEATFFINQMYIYFTVTNAANMFGQLTYDLLLRNY